MAGFYYGCQSPDSNFQPSREALADSFASKCGDLSRASLIRQYAGSLNQFQGNSANSNNFMYRQDSLSALQ